MSNGTIPCIPFPEAKTIKIPLPFGAELTSIADISNGAPTDCALAHSLMLQIMPVLASTACIMKILKVIKALGDFANSPNPLGALGDLAKAVADVSGCFLLIDPTQILKMIAAILDMIIAYLNCLISAFESIWNFQVGIDFNAAQGNPVLLASLNCAADNSQASMSGMMESMGGIMPLLDMVNMVMDIAGQDPIAFPTNLSTPTPAEIAGGVDPLAPVKGLRDGLVTARSALPV